jgi:hypothetical protein
MIIKTTRLIKSTFRVLFAITSATGVVGKVVAHLFPSICTLIMNVVYM